MVLAGHILAGGWCLPQTERARDMTGSPQLFMHTNCALQITMACNAFADVADNKQDQMTC